MDDHRAVVIRTIPNSVSGKPQNGNWAALMSRLANSLSGAPGVMFTKRAFSGPKHPLQYLAQNDNAKSDSILNRARFANAPHQSAVQVLSTKRWWESQPRSRLGFSPNPSFGPLQ